MRKFWIIIVLGCMGLSLSAEDHVMQATRSTSQPDAPAALSLSLREAQEYALKRNRSLKNASLAVQEAYAQRWQTIAAMLPSVDANYSYTNYLGYSAEMSAMGQAFKLNMPNVGQFGITAAVGINGQGVAGALLQNIAIDMKKIALEQSETELAGNVMGSYVSVLALQSISHLLDSSLNNIEELERMTKQSVKVGVAEQTTADQIHVRVNALKNNINSQNRTIELAVNALKVLLDVPVTTQLTLTEDIDQLLSPETVLNLLAEDFNVQQNLNYRLLEKNAELARRNIHMAGWAYGPTVSLAYNHSQQ